MRFATRRSEEGSKRSLRIARALPPYTSPAARHEAKPLSAPSLLWREGWGEGRVLAKAVQQRGLKTRSAATWPKARCRAAARASQLFKPLAPAVRGGRQGPAGGMGTDAHSFSPGQDALSKSPAAPHGLVGRSPTSAKRGCPSLWLLSLGQTRESDPASGRRSEARRRRARPRQHPIKRHRDNHTTTR